MNTALAYATPEQIGYLKRLCPQAGMTDLQACAIVGKTDFEDLTKSEASKIIGMIKLTIGSEKKHESEGRSKFLTAMSLRRIAEGATEAPADLDEHARWVLDHLRLAIEIKRLAGGALRPEGTNRGGDIKMADLLKHFKTWDELAKAFDVTVPTAKAWGEILPASRAYEAEVKTAGFVTAPRRNA